jgi:hypothetical protein
MLNGRGVKSHGSGDFAKEGGDTFCQIWLMEIA